jgi:hypothetical protein
MAKAKRETAEERATRLIGDEYKAAHAAGPFTANPVVQPHEVADVNWDRELAATLGFDEAATESFVQRRLMGRRHEDRIRQQERLKIGERVSEILKPKFVPTDLQRRILDALDGCAMRKQQLADRVCGGEGSRLYRSRKRRSGDLNELLDLKRVLHLDDRGYYRPDAPPAD